MPAEPLVAKSGAAIYAGAAAVGLVESIVAGHFTSSPLPMAAAFLVAALLWCFGDRFDRRWLYPLGPIGAVLIGAAVATSPPGEGSAMYVWSVLWVASFFGGFETVFVVIVVALTHGVVVLTGPEATFDRWFDVTATIAVIGIVVRTLAARNAKLVARLTEESRVDPLTGLLNRRGLEERFGVEITRAVRDRRPLAVVAIDVDHFKQINDDYGHQAGDRALVWLSSLLCEQTRGADIVARVGGEEFVIVLPGADGPSTLEFAERVRHAIEDADAEIPMTVSAGVASALAPSTAHTLLGAADRALYAAKHAGRNRVSYTRS